MFNDGNLPVPPGLPPFAPVSVRLLEILSREDAVIEQIAELLRLDPAFVGEVLRLANSPAFGFERQIRTLAQAVAQLGTKRLRALIATVGLRQSSQSHISMRGYWRHSVAAGFLAAEMAPAWSVNPDQAYTAALLHDPATLYSLAGVPAPLAEADPLESLHEVVAAACRMSEALGFPVMPESAPQHEFDAVLRSLPEPAREPLRVNPARLAQALEEKIAMINN